MALESGTKLGHYEVTAPIGKGRMGEVYRARDTKLGREAPRPTASGDAPGTTIRPATGS